MEYTLEFWCCLIIDRIWNCCFFLSLSRFSCSLLRSLYSVVRFHKHNSTRRLSMCGVYFGRGVVVFVLQYAGLCVCVRIPMVVCCYATHTHACAWKQMYGRKYTQQYMRTLTYVHRQADRHTLVYTHYPHDKYMQLQTAVGNDTVCFDISLYDFVHKAQQQQQQQLDVYRQMRTDSGVYFMMKNLLLCLQYWNSWIVRVRNESNLIEFCCLFWWSQIRIFYFKRRIIII